MNLFVIFFTLMVEMSAFALQCIRQDSLLKVVNHNNIIIEGNISDSISYGDVLCTVNRGLPSTPTICMMSKIEQLSRFLGSKSHRKIFASKVNKIVYHPIEIFVKSRTTQYNVAYYTNVMSDVYSGKSVVFSVEREKSVRNFIEKSESPLEKVRPFNLTADGVLHVTQISPAYHVLEKVIATNDINVYSSINSEDDFNANSLSAEREHVVQYDCHAASFFSDEDLYKLFIDQ